MGYLKLSLDQLNQKHIIEMVLIFRPNRVWHNLGPQVSFLNCDKISKKYFWHGAHRDLDTINNYIDGKCYLNYFILLYLSIGLFYL